MATDPAMAPAARRQGTPATIEAGGRLKIWVTQPPRSVGVEPERETSESELAPRRVLNVVLACIGILLALPIALIIAVVIRLTSPGPIIYKQTRVGIDRRRTPTGPYAGPSRRRVDYGGRLFTMYKFRTMRWDPESTVQIWAARNDSRVTRFGRFLRLTRLDELPQLINVIKGDMNLVGPRPEQPRIFGELREQIEGYAERQRVLPGLTGWAQVNGSYDSNLDDVRVKLRHDLEYIRRQSCAMDLAIVGRTIAVVLLAKGSR